MSTYTYEAFWREQGSEVWNRITSSTPITWTQQITQGVEPVYPFMGGQCSGVNYIVTYQLRRQFSGVWQYTSSNTRTVLGPVSISKDNPTGVSCSPSSGLKQANAAIYSGTGQKVLTLANLCVDVLPGYIINSVARQDGQADNCGNPPPTTAGVTGDCKTTFSTGLIVTRSQCIEVTTKPPECDCCAELLPKANAILARL